VRGGEWKDVKDGFDYKAAVEKLPSYVRREGGREEGGTE
jgi:hypothetical protein